MRKQTLFVYTRLGFKSWCKQIPKHFFSYSEHMTFKWHCYSRTSGIISFLQMTNFRSFPSSLANVINNLDVQWPGGAMVLHKNICQTISMLAAIFRLTFVKMEKVPSVTSS